MRSTRHVCLLAVLLLLASAKAAGSPFAGVWEGKSDGRKSVTVRISDDGAAIHGTAVFYITDDNGDGSHNGDALPPLAFEQPGWDGAHLRFTLTTGGVRMAFVMKITVDHRAELRYRCNQTAAEAVIMLSAIR
jgi:hypothetical protein